eukprot:5587805-Pleurochrysis_carterae.AAC.1
MAGSRLSQHCLYAPLQRDSREQCTQTSHLRQGGVHVASEATRCGRRGPSSLMTTRRKKMASHPSRSSNAEMTHAQMC